MPDLTTTFSIDGAGDLSADFASGGVPVAGTLGVEGGYPPATTNYGAIAGSVNLGAYQEGAYAFHFSLDDGNGNVYDSSSVVVISGGAATSEPLPSPPSFSAISDPGAALGNLIAADVADPTIFPSIIGGSMSAWIIANAPTVPTIALLGFLPIPGAGPAAFIVASSLAAVSMSVELIKSFADEANARELLSSADRDTAKTWADRIGQVPQAAVNMVNVAEGESAAALLDSLNVVCQLNAQATTNQKLLCNYIDAYFQKFFLVVKLIP